MKAKILNAAGVIGLTVALALPWLVGVVFGAVLLAFRAGFVLGFNRLSDALTAKPAEQNRVIRREK
jgi:hypothetical protein